MSKSNAARRYRITNWSDYNKSLITRGSLTVWIDNKVWQRWYAPRQSKRNGHPIVYADEVFLMALTIRAVYSLPLRALEGFLQSILCLLKVDLKAPSYTQICRRSKTLGRRLKRLSQKRPTDIVFDSTGLKVYGEGEWKVRVHGKSKRRTWRKLHIGMDPDSGQILAAELTSNSEGDGAVAERLIGAMPKSVVRYYGDGAYDSIGLRRKIAGAGAIPKIAPPRNAAIGSDCDEATKLRNKAILEIHGLGGDDRARTLWKKLIGYHRRSLVETTMYRFKQTFGAVLRSRCWENQVTETNIKCLILNAMCDLSGPEGHWEENLKKSA